MGDVRYIAWAGYDLAECEATPAPTASGCTLIIWNGTGLHDHGGDWTHSGHGTESVAARYAGTNGLDATSFTKNSIIQFTEPSEQNVSDYDILRFQIQLKEWPTNGNVLLQFDDGNAVSLSDHLDTQNLDVWQEITIALESFGLDMTDPVYLRQLTMTSNVTTVGFYLDDVEFVVGVVIDRNIPVDRPTLIAENVPGVRPILRAFGPPSDL